MDRKLFLENLWEDLLKFNYSIYVCGENIFPVIQYNNPGTTTHWRTYDTFCI